jgi:hypothetical protein
MEKADPGVLVVEDRERFLTAARFQSVVQFIDFWGTIFRCDTDRNVLARSSTNPSTILKAMGAALREGPKTRQTYNCPRPLYRDFVNVAPSIP